MYYHDKDYDGIVLKIPSGVIRVNEMDDMLSRWKKEYDEAVKLSVYHPDHQRNLNEFEDFSKKSDELKEENKKSIERLAKAKQREERLLKHEILPIEEGTNKDAVETYRLWLGDKLVKDIFTKKHHLKSSVKKEVDKFIQESTLEEFKEFVSENSFNLPDLDSKEFNHKRCYINKDSYGNVCLNWYYRFIHLYHSGVRATDKMYYRRVKLSHDSKGDYYYFSGFNSNFVKSIKVDNNTRFILTDYKLNGDEFVKKFYLGVYIS